MTAILDKSVWLRVQFTFHWGRQLATAWEVHSCPQSSFWLA